MTFTLPRITRRGRTMLAAVAGLALLLTGGAARDASAQALRIAAVVNGEIISEYDVANRVAMARLSGGPAPNRALLLSTLIDETLMLQMAERVGVTVSEPTVQARWEQIEATNRMAPGELLKVFESFNADPESLRRQIRANVAWMQAVGDLFSEYTTLSERDIADMTESLRHLARAPRRHVAEIFLPVTDPAGDAAVADRAWDLVGQLRDGADFATLAQEHSKGPQAAAGGDLGWILPEDMPPGLDEILRSLAVGEVSTPAATMRGYHILTVLDERAPTVELEVTLELAQTRVQLRQRGNMPHDALIAAALAQATGPSVCGDGALPELDLPGVRVARGKISLDDLAPMIRAQVAQLSPGEVANPILLNETALLITLCAREEVDPSLPERQEIITRLRAQRLEARAIQHLRALRDEAIIEIRPTG